jgi:RNA polymerase sigma-70 factor (ECF subfamily)
MSLTAWPLAGNEALERDDEERLIEHAKTDREARGDLYRQHYSTVYRFVHRRVGNRHVADDIVSDVFLAMVKNLHQFHHRGVPFRAWLYRLANTQLSRWARRRRRWAVQQWYDMSKHEDPHNDDTRLDSEMVEIVLLTLPPRFQTVFTLHYLAELSVKEIAEVLNCRLGTVKSRLSRGRKMMRERLSKKGP